MLTYGPHNLAHLWATQSLTQYGEITMATVRQQAEQYQPEVFAIVSIDPTRYRFIIPAAPAQANQPAQPEEIVHDGPCFL